MIVKFLNRAGLRTLVELRVQTQGQDLIEYSLMAGFVASAAGALLPQVASNISQIFSKVASVLGNAAARGNIPTG